jgi:CRISPR-associated protein Csx16
MFVEPGSKALTRRYAVTRHRGAAEWIKARFPDAEIAPHIDPEAVRPGDSVIGTLSVHLAADVVARGAEFLHLVIDAPSEVRGHELTAEEMDRYGARVVPFVVRPTRLVGWMRWATPDRLWRSLSWMRIRSLPLAILLGVFWLALAPSLLANLIWDGYVTEAGRSWSRALAGIAAVAAWIAIAATLYGLRHRIVASHVARSPRVQQRPILVMGLSPLAADDRRAAATAVLGWAERVPLSILSLPSKEISARRAALQASGSAADKPLLDTLVGLEEAASSQAFRWQQNMRAVAAQLPGLRAVVVVSSPQSKEDFGLFESFLRRVLGASGHDLVIMCAAEHVADFESYDALNAAFKAAGRTAASFGAGPRDLCIDITAGQKVFSIAGVIATLNRETVFTYVNPAGEVASYVADISLGDVGN